MGPAEGLTLTVLHTTSPIERLNKLTIERGDKAPTMLHANAGSEFISITSFPQDKMNCIFNEDVLTQEAVSKGSDIGTPLARLQE